MNRKLQARPLKGKQPPEFSDRHFVATSAEAVYAAALLLQDLAQHMRQLPLQLQQQQQQLEQEGLVVPDAVQVLLAQPQQMALLCMQVGLCNICVFILYIFIYSILFMLISN